MATGECSECTTRSRLLLLLRLLGPGLLLLLLLLGPRLLLPLLLLGSGLLLLWLADWRV